MQARASVDNLTLLKVSPRKVQMTRDLENQPISSFPSRECGGQSSSCPSHIAPAEKIQFSDIPSFSQEDVESFQRAVCQLMCFLLEERAFPTPSSSL